MAVQLCRWNLEGFRSVRDSVSLELGPLNVLVGANSAGKSSLVHSILLASQTLSVPDSERPLVLNGSLVQLGLPQDCVHEEAGRSFGFGFSLRGADPRGAVEPGAPFDLSVRFGIRKGEFVIDELSIHVPQDESDRTEALGETALLYRRQPQKEAISTLRAHGLSWQRARSAVRIGIQPLLIKGTLDEGEVVAARFRQFLPDVFYELDNFNVRMLAEFLDAPAPLSGRRTLRQARATQFWRTGIARSSEHRYIRRPSSMWRQMVLPAPVVKLIRDYLRFVNVPTTSIRQRQMTAGELIELMPSEGSLELLTELAGSEWLQERLSDLPLDPYLLARRSYEPFEPAVSFARRFFSSAIRHLGPLREAPKPLYGLLGAVGGASVGPSGEYTAALLNAYGGRLVDCPDPDLVVTKRMPLGIAVNRWLDALGLLSSVDVEERGKLGYEVHLHIEGVKRPLDLTTVGVGVSQALPVIAQGLVTDPGSVVLFEQPELHLHPDVQAAIGDFFLRLAQSGRQVIVETHSEYLINRLRRRAAEGGPHDASETVRLFFFEREAGTTKVRLGRVNTFGTIPDWPADFMDQSAREIEAIMEAVDSKEDGDGRGAT